MYRGSLGEQASLRPNSPLCTTKVTSGSFSDSLSSSNTASLFYFYSERVCLLSPFMLGIFIHI